MGTLMPDEVAKRWGIKIHYLKRYKQIGVSGIGGKAEIIGIIPKMLITMGSRTDEVIVGICNLGDFDILLGNDITSKL